MAFTDPNPALPGPPTITMYGARFEVPQVDSPNFNLPQTVNSLNVQASAAAASQGAAQGVDTNLALSSAANAPKPGGGLAKIGELTAAIAGLAAIGAAGAALATGKTGIAANLAPGLNVGVGLTNVGVATPTVSSGIGISTGTALNTGIGLATTGINAGVNVGGGGVGVNVGGGGVGVNVGGGGVGVNVGGGGVGVNVGGGVGAGVNLGRLGSAGVNVGIGGVSVGANLGSKCGVGAAIASGAIPGIGVNAGINANIKLPSLGALGGLNLGNLAVGARLKFEAPCIVVDGVGNLWFPDKFPMSQLFGNFALPALGTVLSGQQINIGINAGVNFGFNFNTDLFNFANKFGANIAGSIRGIASLAGALGVGVDIECLTGLLGCDRIDVAASKLKKVRTGMELPKVPLPIVGPRTKQVKVTTTINSKPINDLLNLPKSLIK